MGRHLLTGRHKNTKRQDKAARYPIIEFEDFKMGLHTDQQSIVLGEIMTSRQKLLDENQQLRDDLQDARMMIQVLKRRLQHQQSASVHSQDSTVRAVGKSSFKALEWAHHQRAKNRLPTRKHAFQNTAAPGGKLFTVDKQSEKRLNRTVEGRRLPKENKNKKSAFFYSNGSGDGVFRAIEQGTRKVARKDISTMSVKKPVERPSTPHPQKSGTYTKKKGLEHNDAPVRSVMEKLATTLIREYGFESQSTHSTESVDLTGNTAT